MDYKINGFEQIFRKALSEVESNRTIPGWILRANRTSLPVHYRDLFYDYLSVDTKTNTGQGSAMFTRASPLTKKANMGLDQVDAGQEAVFSVF